MNLVWLIKKCEFMILVWIEVRSKYEQQFDLSFLLNFKLDKKTNWITNIFSEVFNCNEDIEMNVEIFYLVIINWKTPEFFSVELFSSNEQTPIIKTKLY